MLPWEAGRWETHHLGSVIRELHRHGCARGCGCGHGSRGEKGHTAQPPGVAPGEANRRPRAAPAETGGEGESYGLELFLQKKKGKNFSLGFFKSLVDGLNYEEIARPDFTASYLDRHITSIHFYHNMIFIQKGLNKEGSKYSLKHKY